MWPVEQRTPEDMSWNGGGEVESGGQQVHGARRMLILAVVVSILAVADGQRRPTRVRVGSRKSAEGGGGAYGVRNIAHTLSSWHANKPAIYFSSNGADLVVEQLIFGRRKGGVFVEMGGFGFNGDAMSDTLLFERYRDWTGVLFEAYLDNYKQVSRSRPRALWVGKSICDEAAGGSSGGSIGMEFAPGVGKLLSAACEPIGPLLRGAANLTAIDLMSVYLDGNEAAVLSRMDWGIPVHVVVVSMPRGQAAKNAAKREILESKGFEKEERVTVKETAVFVNPRYPVMKGHSR